MKTLIAAFSIALIFASSPSLACDEDDDDCSDRRARMGMHPMRPQKADRPHRPAPTTGSERAPAKDAEAPAQRVEGAVCKKYSSTIGTMITVPCN